MYGGPLNASDITVENLALIVGPINVINSSFNEIDILSKTARFDNCRIDLITISNHSSEYSNLPTNLINNNPKKRKIIINNCNIKKIIIKGLPLNIWSSVDSTVGKIVNGTVVIDNDL